MAGYGSGSGSEADPINRDTLLRDSEDDDDLALRVTLERSRVESGGSSSSAPSLVARRGNTVDRAGPDTSPSSPLPYPSGPCSAWPALGARARTAEPAEEDARIGGAGHTVQEAAGRDEARSGCRHYRSAPPDSEDDFHRDIICQSLTSAETDARRCRRKNAKVLRLSIEESARLAKEEARAARRLAGFISSSSSDSGTTSDDDDSSPPAADAYAENYRCSGDPKGKRPARKW